MAEQYYIKDLGDGQEYCISGDKMFYLINVTKEVEELRTKARKYDKNIKKIKDQDER